MSESSLAGRRAVVTGGAGDIGAAIALELVASGALVTVVDAKNDEDAEPWLAKIRAAGEFDYTRMDICQREAIDEFVRSLPPFDFVFCNAGIVDAAPFLEITGAQWTRHLDVNLTGAFNVAQATARRMVAGEAPGRIVFTGSWVGDVPWPDIAAYSVTKAGVRMLARSMARELATHGITVNVIAPGIVDAGLARRQAETDPVYAKRVSGVIPLGRMQQPEDVAKLALFLCGDGAREITGSVLLVDGGLSLFQFSED